MDINNQNSILEEDYNVKKMWKIKIFPTVMVNNKTLQGSLNSENLFEAICAGFSAKPQVCYDKGYFFRAQNGKEQGVSFSTVFFIVLLLVVLNVFIYMICRKYIVKRINDRIDKVDINGRINTVVTSYLALKD